MTGIDNNIEVRLIYLDTKEEIWFRSIAKAIRFLGTDYKTIMTYMNPINKKNTIIFVNQDSTNKDVLQFLKEIKKYFPIPIYLI